MKSAFFLKYSLVGIAFTTLIGCKNAGNKDADKAKEVSTTVLTLHTVEMSQTYVCDIQAAQFVEIRPKIEGFIETILVDEGQKVKKGDRLFLIDSNEYNENVKEAQAALKQAEAEYQMAIYEKSRINRLVEKNIISSIRLNQANSEVEVAQLKVEQAKAHLKRSLVKYNYTVINAPYNGYIDRIPFKVGSLVNTESLLTTISDVSTVFAYYKMNETDYLKYKRTQVNDENISKMDSVQLILPDGSLYEYKGKVETVEGSFERGTGSIAFRARFPNPKGLIRHGVTGKINMTAQLSNVYLIPQQSTFEVQEFSYVYIVDSENRVRIRSFEPLGRYNGFFVTRDFDPNTQIVYSGIQSVKDGVKIVPDVKSFTQIKNETTSQNKDSLSK